ncbi:hypothetical protein HDU84_002282 [Entophlyctis sp. JEL0112]|nr:hypothetical protein HDU84_002282 [Entophlyctis sp. JEL0112]
MGSRTLARLFVNEAKWETDAPGPACPRWRTKMEYAIAKGFPSAIDVRTVGRMGRWNGGKGGWGWAAGADAPFGLWFEFAAMGDHQRHQRVVSLLPGVSVCAALLLVTALLADIASALPAQARALPRAALILNLAMCLVVLPLAVLRRIPRPAAMVVFAALALAFSRIPSPLVVASFKLLPALVGRVGTLGVALMAALAGTAAVSAPAAILAPFVATRAGHHVVDSAAVTLAERRLDDARDSLFTARRRAESLDTGMSSNGGRDGSFLRRVVGSLGGGARATANRLQSDIRALEAVVFALEHELEDLVSERDRYERSKTCKGFAENFVAVCLAIYCAYKVVTSCFNIVFGRHGGTDPITLGINMLIHFSSTTASDSNADIDAEKIAQQLSFLMVGMLVILSTRSLVLQFSKAVRLTSSVKKASFKDQQRHSELLALIFSEILCIYCISLVLMMRTNLPPQYRFHSKSISTASLHSETNNRAIITSILAGSADADNDHHRDVRFDFYQQWFDVLFVISAVATFVFVFATMGGNGVGADSDMLLDASVAFGRGRSAHSDGGGDGGILGRLD